MATTFTKLRDGTWGLRSTDRLTAGQEVLVEKRDGTTQTAMVGRVLWSGDGVTLASIADDGSREKASNARGGRRSHGGSICAACGRSGADTEDLEDGLVKHYRCCDMPS